MKSESFKPSIYSSLALALSSFGDAFLYPFLPVNHESMGVPLVWVGVLLSINRFVRIFFNTPIVNFISKYGLRTCMLTAAVVAVISTAGYAFVTSIAGWIALRIAWGLSFSVMRIGSIGYCLDHPQPGLALGISKGLQESGPMIALFVIPFFMTFLHAGDSFIVLALLSLPAVYFAFHLPNVRANEMQAALFSFKSLSVINSLTLLLSVLIDGALVIILGVLFMHSGKKISMIEATALAAFYLAFRRICTVLISPLGGWIADHLGVDKVATTSIIVIFTGIIMTMMGWMNTGLILIFVFHSIVTAITPALVSHNADNPLGAVAENATWRDIGAAAGTLLGGALLSTDYLTEFFFLASFGLAILILARIGSVQKFNKMMTLWKQG